VGDRFIWAAGAQHFDGRRRYFTITLPTIFGWMEQK
jgi:hypothetical protein